MLILNRILKTIGTLSLFLLAAKASCAQAMDKPEVNGFTNEVTKLTMMEQIAASPGDGYTADYMWLYFTVQQQDKFTLFIRADAQYQKHDTYTINNGSHIYFKLKNGTLISFTNTKAATAVTMSVHNHYENLTYWSANAVFSLTCNDVDKLIFADFTGVRIETSNGPLDFAIKPKDSKVLNKMADLIEGAGGGCPYYIN